MIASTHIAAGLVAGMTSASVTKNRFLRLALAFTLALASHLLLDAIPHSDYASLSRSAIRVLVPVEFVVVSAISAYILRGRLRPHWPEYLLAGLFGSVLPDAKFITSIVLSDRNARLVENFGNRLHEGFHAGPTSLAVGVTIQVACAILLLAFLYAFPRTSSPAAPDVRRSGA